MCPINAIKIRLASIRIVCVFLPSKGQFITQQRRDSTSCSGIETSQSEQRSTERGTRLINIDKQIRKLATCEKHDRALRACEVFLNRV